MTGAAIALAMVLGTADMAQAQGGPRAAAVGVDTVKEVEMTRTEPVLGRVVARQAGTISALVPGPMDEMIAHVGDRVTKAQVLARLSLKATNIEQALAEADLKEARAAAETARAQLESVRTERNRVSRLRGSTAFSQARLEDLSRTAAVASARIAENEARVARAEAEIDAVELKIFYSSVRAPFDGVITRRHVDRGTFVMAGAPIFEILNDRALEIEVDVPQVLLPSLTEGRTVQGVRADGSSVDLKVRAIVPEENALTRTRAVRFAFVGDVPEGLASGASLTVNVPSGEARKVLSVHKDAVIASPQGKTVFVIEDGKAAIRPIEIGSGFNGRFVLLSGLASGEQVVIRGNERLFPGQPVQPLAAPSE
ncbi:MAG: efflux RND transporter periplasmic adaptor subunit [Alphaproteobacteria bacterium]